MLDNVLKEGRLISQKSGSLKRVPVTQLQEVAKALAGDLRLRILEVLGDEDMSISQLMQALGAAQPTISINVQILEGAGLVSTKTGSNREKLCTRIHDSLLLELPNAPGEALLEMEDISMPIGMYTDCSVQPTCGLASKENIIGCPDDPRTFYLAERSEASLLWFSETGYVEYRFPNPMPPGIELTTLALSAEMCSEALAFNADWPSDVSIFINGKKISTVTCPGDFGEEKGKLTPNWWLYGTQYGKLYEWRIQKDGSYVDGEKCSDVTLEDLNLQYYKPVTVRFEIEETAENRRGLNLFGSAYGNYEQDIKLSFIRKKE